MSFGTVSIGVQSYFVYLFASAEGETYQYIHMDPPPDFHGAVNPVWLYYLPNQAFSASYVTGADPYYYTFYVLTGDETLLGNTLEILERSGPKSIYMLLESEIPLSGSYEIPILEFSISTGSLSAQLADARRHAIPEKLRKLLPVQKTVEP